MVRIISIQTSQQSFLNLLYLIRILVIVARGSELFLYLALALGYRTILFVWSWLGKRALKAKIAFEKQIPRSRTVYYAGIGKFLRRGQWRQTPEPLGFLALRRYTYYISMKVLELQIQLIENPCKSNKTPFYYMDQPKNLSNSS